MLGSLAVAVIGAVESAIVVGGLSALGAALYGLGIPKDSIIQYEAAVKADNFLVMVHGDAANIVRAKEILEVANPSRIDVHAGVTDAKAEAHLAPGTV